MYYLFLNIQILNPNKSLPSYKLLSLPFVLWRFDQSFFFWREIPFLLSPYYSHLQRVCMLCWPPKQWILSILCCRISLLFRCKKIIVRLMNIYLSPKECSTLFRKECSTLFEIESKTYLECVSLLRQVSRVAGSFNTFDAVVS